MGIEIPREIEKPEPALEDWDPSKMPKEIKKEVRRELHWIYWLQGKTYREITAITGFHRSTIWEDLKWVQENLGATPKSMHSIRETALLGLRFTRSEVLEAARNAQDAKKVSYAQVAKLYEVAAGIDKLILTRYTPAEALQKPQLRQDLEAQLKAMVKFMVSKMGPEALDGFEEFFRGQLALQDSLKNR